MQINKLNNFLIIFYRESAFLLADPFVVDMLARNAISLLNKCVQNELLPRVNLKKKKKKLLKFNLLELYRTNLCLETIVNQSTLLGNNRFTNQQRTKN